MSNTGELEIRRYVPSDTDAVWDSHNRALIAIGAHSGNRQWGTDVRNIEAGYLTSSGEFLVGSLDGQLVGMGACDSQIATRADSNGCVSNPNVRGVDMGLSSCIGSRIGHVS